MELTRTMAEHFSKYGDVLTGFVVLQSLALAIALGKRDTFADSLLNGRVIVRRLLWYAAAGYVFLMVVCGALELALRPSETTLIKIATGVECLGRLLIVAVAARLAIYALDLQPQKHEDLPKPSKVTSR
jgi:hypothetical protein